MFIIKILYLNFNESHNNIVLHRTFYFLTLLSSDYKINLILLKTDGQII